MKMETEYLVHAFSPLRPQHFSSELSRVLEDSLIEIELYFFIRKIEEFFLNICIFCAIFRLDLESVLSPWLYHEERLR